jgi:hypothetical protein
VENDFPRIILRRSQKLEVGFIQSGQAESDVRVPRNWWENVCPMLPSSSWHERADSKIS